MQTETIRKGISTLLTVAVLATAGTTMLACERKGPAEKAGEKIDRAADNISDAVDPKGPLEKAGRAIDRATDGK
jgi:hypothetical protein